MESDEEEKWFNKEGTQLQIIISDFHLAAEIHDKHGTEWQCNNSIHHHMQKSLNYTCGNCSQCTRLGFYQNRKIYFSVACPQIGAGKGAGGFARLLSGMADVRFGRGVQIGICDRFND